MSVGVLILVAGLIAVAAAYGLTVLQNRRGGGSLSDGVLLRGSEGGVSPLVSLLMLLGQAAVVVGIVWIVVSLF